MTLSTDTAAAPSCSNVMTRATSARASTSASGLPLGHVGNRAPVPPSVKQPCSIEEQALLDAIRSTGDPHAAAVAAMLETRWQQACNQVEREHYTAKYRAVLEQRQAARELPQALGLNALRAGLGQLGWRTLSHAAPNVAALTALAQLAGNGNWRQASVVLPALMRWLPMLRTHAQFDALVLALPAALRDSLAALQRWMEDADDRLVPPLRVDPVTAIVVTALLWQVQRALPRPQTALRGMAGFIAQLPQHWQQLSVLMRTGRVLFAPVSPSLDAPRQLTHVRAVPVGIVPAPPLPLEAAVAPGARARGSDINTVAAPLAVPEAPEAPEAPAARMAASCATRLGDNALVTLGAGMAMSGLAMIRWGWALLSGQGSGSDLPPPVRPSGNATLPPLDDLVALLDSVVDVDGERTVWQDLRLRLQDAAPHEPADRAEQVQQRLIANDLVSQVLAYVPPGSFTSEAAPSRVRRAAAGLHGLLGLQHAGDRKDAAQHSALGAASKRLAEAVETMPTAPADPEDVMAGNEDRVSLATARMQIARWLARPGTTLAQQKVALATALRNLAFSDIRLELVGNWLPALDKHIEAELVQHIRQVTNNTVVPSAIYRNTFRTYPRWAEWEAQFAQPDSRLFPLYRPYPDGRVRSDMVSSHDLVSATVLKPETDMARTGLYYSGLAMAGQGSGLPVPSTYFPDEECKLVSLTQFNDAIRGRDYMGSFGRRFEGFVASCRQNGSQPEAQAYVDAMQKRLQGAGTLLDAMGRLDEAGTWLLQTLLRYPTRFGLEPLGRALALPGQDIRVHALQARPAGGGQVPLYGLLLVQSLPSPERATGAVLVIAPSRLPIVEQFASQDAALQQLRGEVEPQLHRWVAVGDHNRWAKGDGPVQLGAAVDAHLLLQLFRDELALRSLQLRHAAKTTVPAAQARQEYLALDRQLCFLPPPVPVPALVATHERLATSAVEPYEVVGAHWLGKRGMVAQGVLRNAELEDARWLAWLGTTRGLVTGTFPLLAPYVADRLAEAILRDHGVVIDAEQWSLVQFSGGTPSRESPSGFVHSAAQKTGACNLVNCAFTKAMGYPDGKPGTSDLGLYSNVTTTTFDQDTECPDLLPGQFIETVRDLDLRDAYLEAVDTFWDHHRGSVVATLRGVYMFTAWQQFAEGSLSARGLQLALSATGYMMQHQASDPAYRCHLASGTRVSWVSLYGMRSTLLRLDNPDWTPVLLYAPGDQVAFREFTSGEQLDAWLTRVVACEQGRQWLEGAFDLADLQDGWFSNGVSTDLKSAQADLFQGNRSALAIEGSDLFEATATRMQERTVSDGKTVLAADREVLEASVMDRLQEAGFALGLGALFVPELLPFAIGVDLIQVLMGAEEAVDGRTETERKKGAVDAGWGVFALAMDGGSMAFARTAGLASREGGRVVPQVQAVAEAATVDPLARLSERYAQPAGLVVEGARPADSGIYHYAGKHYIRQAGKVYEVFFDKPYGTWRLKNPSAAAIHHDPVRLNAEGLWEPHSEVGLRGGGRDSAQAMRSASVENSFRSALQREMVRSTQSLDSALPPAAGSGLKTAAGAAFKWGWTHWERVELPIAAREAESLEKMEQLFASGRLEPVPRGALAAIIANLQRMQRQEAVLRMEAAVSESVKTNGGRFFPLSQSLLETRSGRGMGLCTGFSRVMAVAIAKGKEMALISNLRQAMLEPAEGIGAELLALVADAQGAELKAGTTSAQARIGYNQVAKFLEGLRKDALFFLSGANHNMLLAVRQIRNGQSIVKSEFMHLDPNTGLQVYPNAAKLNRGLRELFGSRYFSSLAPGAAAEGTETLAEMYGATRPDPFSSPSLFSLREIDPIKLLELASERGWNQLLEDEPAAAAPLAGRAG